LLQLLLLALKVHALLLEAGLQLRQSHLRVLQRQLLRTLPAGKHVVAELSGNISPNASESTH
jgi:hypothetical protein